MAKTVKNIKVKATICVGGRLAHIKLESGEIIVGDPTHIGERTDIIKDFLYTMRKEINNLVDIEETRCQLAKAKSKSHKTFW